MLGRDSIKDHTTALVELVKNSYDADATEVEVQIFCNSTQPYIRISDNGHGMTDDELNKYWLRIGYSMKRKSKFSSRHRRRTGEKGIGRISADRLGADLELRSQPAHGSAVGIHVKWDDFAGENVDIGSVPIDDLSDPAARDSKTRLGFKTGTELLIRSLRQRWAKEEIDGLFDELSTLTPPFHDVTDFTITLSSDVWDRGSVTVESPFLTRAELEFTAKFDGKCLKYSMAERNGSPASPAEQRSARIDWKGLVHKTGAHEVDDTPPYPSLGKVSIKLLFYPRRADLLLDTKLRLKDLRDFLNKNAGVKIYRDQIRVKPYGDPRDPEGDWLGLAERKSREPAGAGRPTYRMAANQIVGAVFLSRDDNPALTDSSSREGLIKGDAFFELRALVLACLSLLEAFRHELFKDRDADKKSKPSPSEQISFLTGALDDLTGLLTTIRAEVKDSAARPVLKALDQVEALSTSISQTRKSVEELVTQSTVLRGLASVGIAAAILGHETQTSIDGFKGAIATALKLLNLAPPKLKDALSELEKGQSFAQRVAAWGTFALARVQQEKRKRKRVDIRDIVNEIRKHIQPALTSADILVEPELFSVQAKTFSHGY